MSKLDIIEYCGDCAHGWNNRNVLLCGLTDLSTSEDSPCPPWCPLPDHQKLIELVQFVRLKLSCKKDGTCTTTPEEWEQFKTIISSLGGIL